MRGTLTLVLHLLEQVSMASISKVVGAIVHGSQEATVALASLNFDFSLVKVYSMCLNSIRC